MANCVAPKHILDERAYMMFHDLWWENREGLQVRVRAMRAAFGVGVHFRGTEHAEYRVYGEMRYPPSAETIRFHNLGQSAQAHASRRKSLIQAAVA